MALIGRIRNNLWLVILLLGFAMLGFIFMDMSAGDGSSLFGGSQSTLGEVNGKKIDYIDFDNKIRLRYSGANVDQFTLRNALWNSLVNEAVIEGEAKKLGITVTDSELDGLLYGPNYSPIIRQDFSTNPGQFGGQVDSEQLNQIRDLEASGKMNPNYIPVWEEEKVRVVSDRLQSKMTNLVSKSIYAPTWMVNMKHQDDASASVSFVRIPFDKVDNSEIALEDADYANYLKENAARYEMEEEQMTLKYIVFDVLPTPEDSANVRAGLEELKVELAKQTGDGARIFVESKRGIYDEAYVFEDALTAEVKENLFDAEVGSVYGPYLDGNNYKVAKLLNRDIIPDSVSVRHILRSTNPQDPTTLRAAMDSINLAKKLYEGGTITFDSLVTRFSQDPGSMATGGKYENFAQGTMVKPFNDAAFFNSKPGDIKIVETQYGVHLIEVLSQDKKSNKKGVQIVYLQEPMIPSKNTAKEVYKEALTFASNNQTLDAMKKAAGEAGMDILTSAPLDKNGFNIEGLGAGEQTRQMVKWANDASVGNVSPTVYRYNDKVRYYENKYVVTALSSRNPAGLPTVASMKKTIGNLVMNEKKGEMIKGQIADMDLAAIAEKYELKVDSTNVSFSGNSPDAKFVAAVFGVQEGQKTTPVVGTNGVFVGVLNSKPTAATAVDVPTLRNTMSAALRSSARSSLFPALRKNADIDDKRTKFF